MYTVLMGQDNFSVCNSVNAYREDCCCGGTKLKQWVTVLLACIADGSDKLPTLVMAHTQAHVA
jgi:hypothetical protein